MSFLTRLLLLNAILFTSINIANSQDCNDLTSNLMWDFQVVIPPPNTTLIPGETFFIECIVTGFVDIISFQYSINYNPSVINFSAIDNVGSPLIGNVDGNFTPEAQEIGSLALFWVNLNGEGQTLPDNSAIFKLFFEVIGDPNECSLWDINSSSVDLEITFELPNGDLCIELVDINFDLTGVEGDELCIDCSDLFLTTNACGTMANSGTIQFNACGGLAPYTYTVEGSNGPVDSGILNGSDDIVTLTGLETGAYQVELFDATGTPIDPDQGLIEVVSGPGMTAEIGILKDIVCIGIVGDLVAFVDGGTAPYNYSWSNGLFSDTAEDVPQGIYTVTVTDSNGCEAVSLPINLGETAALPIIVLPDPANFSICAGDDIILLESGGEAASWSWTGPNGFSSTDQNPTISNIGNAEIGTYMLEIASPDGCTNTGQVNITLIDNSIVCLSGTGELCADQCTGADFIFQISPDSTLHNITLTFPGTGIADYNLIDITNGQSINICSDTTITTVDFDGSNLILPTGDLTSGDLILIQVDSIINISDPSCPGVPDPECQIELSYSNYSNPSILFDGNVLVDGTVFNCKTDFEPILNIVDIDGSWLLDGDTIILPIDLTVYPPGEYTLSFTPDSMECADEVSVTLEIEECPACIITDALLSAIECNSNETNSELIDDFLIFNLDPQGSLQEGSYSVTVSAGNISPSIGMYGGISTFELQPGSAGGGNVIITIQDDEDPACNLDVVLEDPGSCSVIIDATEDLNLSTIELYPNPTHSEVNISDANFNYDQIKLISLDGKELFISDQKHILKLTELQTGLYIIQFINKGEVMLARKVVKE